MNAQFINPEGSMLPPVYDRNPICCPNCGPRSSGQLKRITTGYDFHIEHVELGCKECGETALAFDVLTEANLSFPQLPAVT